MTKHLNRDMEAIHREILSLSSLVEEMIDKASRALCERHRDYSEEIRDTDELVDKREVHIEEECLKILALHQPVAVDLRRIATVLKVNNDLERVADLAVNIAERAACLSDYPAFPIPGTLEGMVHQATRMFRESLDSFVRLDAELARQICVQDDEVDRDNRIIIDNLLEQMQEHPEDVPPALHCFSAVRHIERIADHATNIAEDVIYLVEGEIVRHQHDL